MQEWLSWIIIGMGPMWVVKTGDDRREAGTGRTVSASVEDGKDHKECVLGNGLSYGNAALSTHLAQGNKCALF